MIYILLNFILCGVLIWTSFTIDTRNTVKNNNPLVNMILFLATILALNGFCIISGFWGPAQLTNILTRIRCVLIAWYGVYICQYLLLLPSFKKNKAFTVMQWILNVFAAYIVFISPGGITSIKYSMDSGMVIGSSQIFADKLGQFFPLTKYGFYCLLYYFVLPLLCILMVLVRAENMNSKLDRQRMRINVLAVVSFWISYTVLRVAKKFQPMFSTMELISFICEVLLFMKAASLNAIWDFKTIVRSTVRFILRFAIPSTLGGLAFILLWQNVSLDKSLLVFLFIVSIVIIITIWYQGRKLFKNKNFLRDNNYAKIFEDALAAIDYSNDTKEITTKLFDIFNKNVNTSALQIMIDGGMGDLETIYSSNNQKSTIPLTNNICFDTLLNINHPIVFRDFAEHNYNVVAIRKDLLKMLDDNNSDAFIMLNEGRHIVGVMFLGKKTTDNVYNDYDYMVFSKLYSYFFVIGYYMKNIANESVVGTVNREIRMSGQIITSIQENMDLIKNPKVDAGYIMVPAHNIGGEFIDLIRLTDTRHIFVIGAMSGKGIAASMSMVILKSVIRTFLAETKDFKLLVEKINTFIRFSLPKGTFFAGMFGLIDFASDTMYYINCGAPALFLYTRAYNNVIEIQGEGRVLGFAKDIDKLIKVKKVKLAEGDIVLACTDGLIETHSLRGEVYGKDRTQKALMENSTYSADKMARFTYDSLVQFTSKELEDDVSILVLKYLGGK
jgi:hypothetical protein